MVDGSFNNKRYIITTGQEHIEDEIIYLSFCPIDTMYHTITLPTFLTKL